MGKRVLKPGDWVIYRSQKTSSSPGPRAKETFPATKGETYSYIVDKFWIVQDVLDDGQLRLRTRRGKIHIVSADDPRLRAATWWEQWFWRERFRAVEQSPAENE